MNSKFLLSPILLSLPKQLQENKSQADSFTFFGGLKVYLASKRISNMDVFWKWVNRICDIVLVADTILLLLGGDASIEDYAFLAGLILIWFLQRKISKHNSH